MTATGTGGILFDTVSAPNSASTATAQSPQVREWTGITSSSFQDVLGAGSEAPSQTSMAWTLGSSAACSIADVPVAAAATRLVVTLPGQTFTSGSGNSGTVLGQTAGSSFNITLTTVDASNNVDTMYNGNNGSKTVSYTGHANAPGGTAPS
ncbi:hypothetical protein SBA4_20064 [Candidatus Sulfopaludibacter sp. SbA4]|nr:hypothetical protein SBA4_20064 [Candidatus Sulfopaludibacter sp. SbA4]